MGRTGVLPVLDQGTRLDFVGGMYQDVRYRLAGTLTRGKNLSLTGMQPNAMPDSFSGCLGDLVGQDEFAAATGAGA